MYDFDRAIYLDAIENLVKNYAFNDFLSDPTNKNFSRWMEEMSDFPVLIYTGETKAVLWNEDWPCVIKIPFSHRDFDYCRAEVRNYKKAVKEGLEQYFAFCDLLMEYPIGEGKTVPIYIMEYAEVDEDYARDTIYSYFTSGEHTVDSDYWGSLDDMDDEERVLAYLSDTLSVDEYETLRKFCMDNLINDLHTGNVAMHDGEIIFIDYSGFAHVEKAKNDPDWWVI